MIWRVEKNGYEARARREGKKVIIEFFYKNENLAEKALRRWVDEKRSKKYVITGQSLIEPEASPRPQIKSQTPRAHLRKVMGVPMRIWE